MSKMDEKVDEIRTSLRTLIQNMIFEGRAEIKTMKGEDYAIFFIDVPETQVGRIIGSKGVVIESFRCMLKMISDCVGFHCQVEIITKSQSFKALAAKYETRHG